jgi:uncharacterized Zn finger protein (UPF0148 family)
MHARTTGDVVTLVYLFEWHDKRQVLKLERGKRLVAHCPACDRTVFKLLLTDDGFFRCTVCATGHVDHRVARKQSRTELEKLQIRALKIRKRLGDLESSTDEIVWPEHKMPKKRWLALLDELDVIEPRILELYKQSLDALIDTVAPDGPESRRKGV